jgi:predicted secreted hydrolase
MMSRMRIRPAAALVLALGGSMVAQAPQQFSYPKPGTAFVFPRDHGSHPDFKIEWWYITGHLWSQADPQRRFGFQATFFRSAGAQPGAPNAEPAGNFASEPIYLAHMALLDVKTGKFISQERLNRSGWDAGSSVETLDTRNGNWSLRFSDPAAGVMKLIGTVRSDAVFSLSLTPSKPLVRFGRDGVSRKGEDLLASSYYLTFPRLTADGSMRIGEEDLAVRGEAWMDHEISSSQLAANQVGWDWAAIQLHDGREIMAYRMRLENGATDRFSTLAWVDAKGVAQQFAPEHFTWRALQQWKSPHTGAEYPSGVEITTIDPNSGAKATLRLVPFAVDQELTGGLGGVAYWEGACRVLDEGGKEIGSAFLELTGYAGKIIGLQ